MFMNFGSWEHTQAYLADSDGVWHLLYNTGAQGGGIKDECHDFYVEIVEGDH